MTGDDSFDLLFERGTGHAPFPFQRRLAAMTPPPELLRAPTGSGKTQAVLLAWLWQRRFAPDREARQRTPRRLVYVLPMRTLVEQTRQVAEEVLNRLALADSIPVYPLLGGDTNDDWYRFPERDAILVGTQDMVLSRALNRGYALSRFAWPRAFALLHNDAYWVLDEVQLMGSGLASSTQLAGLRSVLGTTAPVWSTWMSATAEPSWLRTVDHAGPAPDAILELSDADRAPRLSGQEGNNPLAQRLEASKTLRNAGVTVKDEKSANELAQRVLAAHVPASLTLVVVNTVGRARALRKELDRQIDRLPSGSLHPQTLLLHSRFRRPDREAALNLLTGAARLPGDAGTIAVCTQVVEAGVDISARTLITELAPWTSLVQRLGRLNRRGEFTDATALWVDIKPDDEKTAKPYDAGQVADARARFGNLEGRSVSPQSLDAIDVRLPFRPAHVLRRRDLLGLFDTTADLTEVDLDVSPYVRDLDDSRDVQVFWRDWPSLKAAPSNGNTSPTGTPAADKELSDVSDLMAAVDAPDELESDESTALSNAAAPVALAPPDLPPPAANELCSVPIGELRDLLRHNIIRAFRRDAVDGRWMPVRGDELLPGMEVLLHTSAGRYTPEGGWDVNATADVPQLQPSTSKPDTLSGDPWSETKWQTLAEHTTRVANALERLLADIDIPNDVATALRLAARWHDRGKAHRGWQARLGDKGIDPRPSSPTNTVFGKAPVVDWRKGRPYLRHELASALALLADPAPLAALSESHADLVRYVIAAHHGKVRLAIRSLPGEMPPTQGPARTLGDDVPGPVSPLERPSGKGHAARWYALGILEGDALGACDLGDAVTASPVTLSLESMLLGEHGGRPSWVERMRRLRDAPDIGPFRLAFYETLLRAADSRADEGIVAPERGDHHA